MTSEHTACHAHFLIGIFVLTKGEASTAVVPAVLFGEGEHFGQPTSLTCNYKSWQKEPETEGSAEPLVSLGWLSVNRNKLKAYQLVVQEAAWKEREI